jgi:S-DNA-T family DNA segregation ATPase FtsK/SpoIIIE
MGNTTTVALNAEQTDVLAKLVSKAIQLGVTMQFEPPVAVGPVVSVYRFRPIGSTRVSTLEGLADDFAVALGVESVLVRKTEIFVPNKERRYVNFRDTIGALWATKDTSSVPLNLGIDHLGVPCVDDLAQLPHLLIAGSTGSGKSTLVTAIIGALVYCKTPDDIQFVLSDTKNVEFGRFIGAPHLMFNPATTIYQTMEQMEWIVQEMESRLKTIGLAQCRNIHEYKEKCPHAKKIPFLVLVIDELADLLSDRSRTENKGPSLGKIAESILGKIVQKSRAAGVYVIAATQRPSVNVVAGSIKANFPARLSFRLPSGPDSRTVLGVEGAEHLLSRGDMLYVSPNRPGVARVHAPWASLEDIDAAVAASIQRESMKHRRLPE